MCVFSFAEALNRGDAEFSGEEFLVNDVCANCDGRLKRDFLEGADVHD